MAGRKRSQDEPQEVPVWIVSFTDMITLLLAFFVLLQAFAKEQSPELFFIGQGSFKRAINGLGLPNWMLGHKEQVERSYEQPRHPAPEQSEPSYSRVIDAEDEKIRQMFAEIAMSFDTRSEEHKEQRIGLFPTRFRFAAGGDELTAEARSELSKLASNIRDAVGNRRIRIYVVALAQDGDEARQRTMLSARRARAVRDFVRQCLPHALQEQYEFVAVGDGTGGDWCKALKVGPGESQAFLAVVEEGR